MAQPEIADIFKYLDGLQAIKTDPEQYVYRLTNRFEIPVDRAEAYVLSWVDEKYLRLSYDINDWYNLELESLRESYVDKLQDVADKKADEISKFNLSQVKLG